MRMMKTLTGAAAAASLALSGVAYAAGTQSVNMLPKSSLAKRTSAPAVDANYAEKERKRRGGMIIWLVGGAALIGGLVVAAGSSGGAKGVDSPG